jgi:hypothetical protein
MHKARGFSDIGYHYLIGLKGEVWEGRKPENSVGAHVQGYNSNTMGISYVGGLASTNGAPKDTRTPEQLQAMAGLLRKLSAKYPKAVILGHRDLSEDKNRDGKITPNEWMKSCPCFDAGAWANSIGLPGGKCINGRFSRLSVGATVSQPVPVKPAKPSIISSLPPEPVPFFPAPPPVPPAQKPFVAVPAPQAAPTASPVVAAPTPPLAPPTLVVANPPVTAAPDPAPPQVSTGWTWPFSRFWRF